jgi:peptidoglycan/LPS O-acetylase OafA/YrhL
LLHETLESIFFTTWQSWRGISLGALKGLLKDCWKYCKLLGGWSASILGDNKRQNNIAVLDGVRAIACLIVLTFHISLITSSTQIWKPVNNSYLLLSSILLSGASGVTLFFVLSGFLLFLPYANALLYKNKWPSARRFYQR